MSGMFGGGRSAATTPIRYNGIQIGQSNAGAAVPLVYGRTRQPFNLLWYGAFSSTPQSGSNAGKGGGGQQTTGYTYKSSFAAGICEGPIQAINQVFLDKDLTSLGKQGMSLFTGAGGQATWAYLTTNFPTQAIPYDHICYVVAQSYTLGSSASLPNLTFEVSAFLSLPGTTCTFTGGLAANATSGTLSSTLANGTWNICFSDFEVRTCTVLDGTATWANPLINAVSNAGLAGITFDASPAAILLDYLTDPNHGCSFPAANVALLTGANSYESYCLSLGIGLSLAETTQRNSSDCIAELMKITNSDVVWSAGTLRVVPYADSPVSGNGYSYTPNLTPEYIFTDDDYLEPPDLKRVATSDTYNHVRIEYLERSNEYNTAIAEATDLGDIALTGERVMDTLSYHEITNSATAGIVAQLVLQTSLYERNTITFKVRADYGLLEPMDYIGIVDTALGYGTLNSVGQYTSGQIFRITKITDDEKDVLEIEAMEVPGAVRTSAVYNWAGVQGYNANFGVAPGSVQAPAFLEAYETLVGPAGGRELWIAIAGPSGSAAWGGCNVYLSFDNVTYTQIATQQGAARYGTLSASLAAGSDPDTVNTLNFQLNNTLDTLTSGSKADADSDRLMLAVGLGATTEIISYETAALVTAGNYAISYLRRGQYGTTSQSHASGAQVIRLDGQVIKLSVDPGYMGVPLYFKFCSFNMVGRATEDLSAVTAYSYTMGQAVAAYNVVSASTFLASGSCVMYSPTTAFKNVSGATAWESSVYSTQSYLAGCTVECVPNKIPIGGIMLGLTTNPKTSNSYANLNYAVYMTSGAAIQIYESGVNAALGSAPTYAAGDLFAVTYDGKHIAYYHNGILLRSVSISGLAALYAQVCFYAPGDSVYALSYDNQSPTSNTVTFLNFNANSAIVGNTARKTSNTTAWDAAVYSTQGYTNGCALSAQQLSASASSNDMVGLTLNPTASVSYTNLAYALDFGNGNWFVYENGAGPYISGSYTVEPIFEITYDGKHVCYYVSGTLVRSVPIANQTFYPQICLGNPGDVVGNISWGPLNSSVTPFTLVPLTNGTAASGTKILSNNQQPNAEFGVRNWTTNESYSNGCTISAICPTSNAQLFGLVNSAVAGSSSSVIAGWYPHSDVGGYQILYENTPVGSLVTPITAGDVLTIEYDTFYFYWFLNGALTYQQYSPNAGTLYLYGDFYYQGASFANLSFGPNGALTPNPFLATGNCAVQDSSCLKSASAGAGWDSGFYSINQYLQCHVQFKIGNTLRFMIGLTTTPPPKSGNSSYVSIGYALYSDGAGSYQIYESGASALTIANAPDPTDLLAVTYDGSNVRYYVNGTLERTVAASGLTLSAMGSFYDPGAQATYIDFGPGTTLDTVPTAAIDVNAATSVVSLNIAGPINMITGSISSFTPTLLASINLPGYPSGAQVVITAIGGVVINIVEGETNANIISTNTPVSSMSGVYVGTQVARNPDSSDSLAANTFAFENTYSVAPNTASNYYLYGCCAFPTTGPQAGSYAQASKISFKAEIIKR